MTTASLSSPTEDHGKPLGQTKCPTKALCKGSHPLVVATDIVVTTWLDR